MVPDCVGSLSAAEGADCSAGASVVSGADSLGPSLGSDEPSVDGSAVWVESSEGDSLGFGLSSAGFSGPRSRTRSTVVPDPPDSA